MEFTVIIYYSVLSGPAGSMAAMRHSSAVSSTIFGGPQIVKAQLEGPSGMSAVCRRRGGSGGVALLSLTCCVLSRQFTTGVRSFGYELSGKYSDRGRYMEELGFHVATVWSDGVASSLTSVPHAAPCALYASRAVTLGHTSGLATLPPRKPRHMPATCCSHWRWVPMWLACPRGRAELTALWWFVTGYRDWLHACHKGR